MNIIIKAVIISLCGILLVTMLKETGKEYAFIAAVACGMCALDIIIPSLLGCFGEIREIFPLSDFSFEAVRIFFKCVCISQIGILSKSLCKDWSSSFLSSCIDLAEKAAILIISMPLLKAAVKIILGYIGE